MNKLNKSLNNNFEGELPIWVEDSLKNIPTEWEKILFTRKARKLLTKIYVKIQNCVNDPEENLSPKAEDIFNFAKLTPLDKISIVIIGQDPYPDKNHAHGLSFSSLNTTIPSSLKNIFKCLIKQKFIKKMPKNSNLTIWARRGVLLLNSALTTKFKSRNAHQEIWCKYTDVLIKNLCDYYSKKNKTLIFMLWGNNAQNKSKVIYAKNDDNDDSDSDSTEHIVLRYIHPSPMAQSNNKSLNFINCPNFREANEIIKEEHKLKKTNISEIVWSFRKKKIIIYTDGSAFPNEDRPKAKNGYACLFTQGVFENLVIKGSSEKFIIHPLTKKKMCSTAQRAEGTAIWKALIKCNTLSYDKWDEIEIITDSKHWMDMLLIFIPGWIRKNMDFEDKKVPDITKGMWKEWSKLQKNGYINIRHINSHKKLDDVEKNSQEACDIQNNDTVDQFANEAREELEYGKYVEEYVDFD